MRAGYSRVPHPCATVHCCTVRLACLIHAASVRSEPGSNSPSIIFISSYADLFNYTRPVCLCFFQLTFEFISEFQIFLVSSSAGVLLHLTDFDAGHSHYSIFQGSSELPFRISYLKHSLHRAAQRVLNLASFFVLSNAIQNFFQVFFTRPDFALRPVWMTRVLLYITFSFCQAMS